MKYLVLCSSHLETHISSCFLVCLVFFLPSFNRVNSQGTTQEGDETPKQHRRGKKDMLGSDSDDEDLSECGDEHSEEEETGDCQTEKTTNDVLPNVSAVSIKD